MIVYNTCTKYWSMTWETNKNQKTIPDEHELLCSLRKHCSDAIFQYEKGTLKGKLHIQGKITCKGPRTSKIALLKLFKQDFDNVEGLTLRPVNNKEGLEDYVMKEEGRVKGPFFLGNSEKNQQFSMKQTKLKPWQQDLHQFITDNLSELKNRKVIYVEDTGGNTGKSFYQKWARLAQLDLIYRSLPISNVDRLMSAIHIINKTLDVDVYCIDLTRTKGEDQSYKDLFAAVEQIKNGFVIDTMYGKYNESFFEPPVVIIFSNNILYNPDNPYQDMAHYLSDDRWLHLKIIKNELFISNSKGEYPYLTKVNKEVVDKAAVNSSIEY